MAMCTRYDFHFIIMMLLAGAAYTVSSAMHLVLFLLFLLHRLRTILMAARCSHSSGMVRHIIFANSIPFLLCSQICYALLCTFCRHSPGIPRNPQLSLVFSMVRPNQIIPYRKTLIKYYPKKQTTNKRHRLN